MKTLMVAAALTFVVALVAIYRITVASLAGPRPTAAASAPAQANPHEPPSGAASEPPPAAIVPLGLLGAAYTGVPGDEHAPYTTAGRYNIIADTGGIVTDLDRLYSLGAAEATVLHDAVTALLPADATLVADQVLGECHNYVYTSASLTAQARFHGGVGLTYLDLSPSTGDLDHQAEAYDPTRVNYVNAVGGVDNDLTPSSTC